MSGAFAWTAFPMAAAIYLARFWGALAWQGSWFDLTEVWLLGVASIAMKISSLRADDSLVEDAWRDGLRLGLDRAGHCAAATPRCRFLARPVVWQACGYIACAAWTAAALVTYLVMDQVVRPGDRQLLLGMMLLLVLAVHGTTVRLIGPGLTRVRVAYDTACAVRQSLHAHAEVYECLQEFDALEILDLVRRLNLLKVVVALDELLDKRGAAKGQPHLTLVEDGDPQRGENGRSRPA